MSMNCTIPSNPDVSGVGVRAAIYAQNLTCFLPVIVHLRDRKISRDELKGIKDQSIGMLAVAFAILLTTIILAKGAGGNQTITNYHTAVVLDLSWMNNTSTWIWFILYVYHRSKDDKPTEANWSKWCKALLEPPLELLGQNEGDSDNSSQMGTRICPAQRIWHIAQRIWHFISKQPVLTLGSIHLSLMAAVGIWLWSDPSEFGDPLGPSCDPTLMVVGVPARFSSNSLRIVSLTMYSVVLIPGFNLIPPFVFFLTLHITHNWSRRRHLLFWRSWDKALHAILTVFTKQSSPRSLPPPVLASQPTNGSNPMLRDTPRSPDIESQPTPGNQATNSQNPPSTSNQSAQPAHTGFLIVGLVLLVAINVLFIIDIELTLRRNKGDQNGDEAVWGFGQVLALLLLIIPLRDAWGALQDIREKAKGVQEQFGDLVQRECEATPAAVELERLIKKEAAKPYFSPPDSRFSNFLQMVAYYGKVELVQFFLEKGIEGKLDTIATSPVFLQGGKFKTALQAASARGHVAVVKNLLQSGKYTGSVNEVGGDYGTALCAASANGNIEVVKALLRAGAGLNVDGKCFGAPLHIAVLMENREMVELLISENPNNAECKCECAF
ncbi:Multiple ankyrin repeats single kh domain [Mycena sanguinolenta]|uniref:Multiple ankyrin repeats single kh domain n=1 Tax=Mycena sanguinolenta TaxID=230812 RepID=A0A8H6ZAK7_9AGAR|nr:Multiple ankyrin repeats single kh domain [Mycena sanguinolenta]